MTRENKQKDIQKKIRVLLLVFYDAAAVLLSSFLALFIRYDMSFSSLEMTYMESALLIAPLTMGITWIVFSILHLYDSLWEYASVRELFFTTAACFSVVIIQTAVMRMIDPYYVPRSYHFIYFFVFLLLVAGGRFSYRALRTLRGITFRANREIPHVMVIGGGSAGRMIVDEIKNSSEIEANVCCIIDDDWAKRGKYLRGVEIIGGRERIVDACEKYNINQIILAMPSVSRKVQKDILDICKETECEMKIVPGVYQFLNGQALLSKLRNVEVEDLLGRDPIKVNSDDIYHYITGKTILVTGGGGSIGSELCRQIAAHAPKQLIIFDVYENNAYEIQLELRKNYPDMHLETIIGSVRDSRKIFQVFEQYRPDIVYHAAAHKHVPLMEDSPCEAIKNNVIGTYKTAFAAMTHGCQRFVLISTDKAVNPTNIMGASKRLCEMVIQAFDAKIKEGRAEEIPQLFTHLTKDQAVNEQVQQALKNAQTEFVAVRFGNVLGSNGSVIPLFRKQIEAGGPVTVTHPDIIRYFMTIPEAVGLVLEAGTYANGGQIFVLDMARNMIKLSGYTPDVDIQIEITGLRPGEKLYEEKLMDEEGLQKTDNELIHIGSPVPFDIEVFLGQLNQLMEAAYKNQGNIRELVHDVVETYQLESA